MKWFSFSGEAQRAGMNKPNRKEHVWVPKGDKFKCVVCGAVTSEPPPFPEPVDWEAEAYEALTDAERALCPNRMVKARKVELRGGVNCV